jgi:protoporphyrinogen oxidase
MENRKVIVVGGGMVGLFCAHKLAGRGHEVELIERAGEVGGAYAPRSIAGRYFDNGVHVPGATGKTEIDDFLFGKIDTRAEWLHGYAGLNVASFFNGKLGVKSPLPDLRSLHSLELEEALRGIGKSERGNHRPLSAMRIANDVLGPWVANHVVAPCLEKFYGDAFAEVAPHALEALHLRRVIAFDEAKSKVLKQQPEWDNCIGWPDANSMRGREPIYHYPKGNEALAPLVRRIKEALSARGVTISSSTELVKAHVTGGLLQGFSDKNGAVHKCDVAVWALPAALAARLIDRPRADQPSPPPLRQLWLACAVADRNDLSHPNLHYLTCHDPSVRVARIHLPDALGGIKPDKARVCAEYWQDVMGKPPQESQVLPDLKNVGLLNPKATFVQCEIVKSVAVPILTVTQQEHAVNLAMEIEAVLPNMRCVGLGSTDRFFLGDLLLHAGGVIESADFL